MIADELKVYLEGLIPARTPEVEQMENEARENNIPIMDLIGMETFLQIMRIHKPGKILEVGTAIGYSAIRMCQSDAHVRVITLERDVERSRQAIANIKKFGLSDRIHVIDGDALERIDSVEHEGPYDFIFIDAAKGQYKRFFTAFEKMLTPGGIIISDNVLFRGFVAKEDEEIESRRYRKLTHKIRTYNEFLMEQVHYDTTILPVGDGMAISIKKR